MFQGDDIPCVNLRIGADNITMQAQTASGHSSSAIRAADSIPTPEGGFHFDPRFLLDCLRHTSGPLRVLIDERGFLILEAGQSRYFVCPRRPVKIAEKEVEKTEKKPRAKKSSHTKAA
mgnify:FL=1